MAKNDEKAFEEFERQSPLLMPSMMQEEILRLEIRPNCLFRSMIFALPLSFFMWGIIIWAFL